MIILGPELVFPRPDQADDQGLVALGGDLRPERVLLAYQSGIFPWPIDARVLAWFSPDPRAILELDELHVSRSLAKRIRQGGFEVHFDRAFGEVVRACAERTTRRRSTWITGGILRAYERLHQLGHAHSVEVWIDGALAGGLYGVSIGGLFAGESMFSRVPDTSKIALVALVERMRARGLTLLDVQVPNPHLETLGIRTIPRRAYLERLGAALRLDVRLLDPGPGALP